MKKLSLLTNLAIVLGFAMLIVSCQKQQDAVTTTTTTASTDAAVIKNVSGGGFNGQISLSDAQEMYKTYKDHASNGATEYVSFKISDLQAFLADIQAKYKSDIVYVNLGVYDSKTAPDASLIGKTTIFFGGNNNLNNTHHDGHVGMGMLNLGNDIMNHGQIYP